VLHFSPYLSVGPYVHTNIAHLVSAQQLNQLLAHGRWFSPDTPASSTIKTGRHDIAEIFLKVGLNTKNLALQ
jgi:hypothetical protein